MAIYARENGQGMLFSEREDGGGSPPPGPQGQGQGKSGGRPTLRVVK